MVHKWCRVTAAWGLALRQALYSPRPPGSGTTAMSRSTLEKTEAQGARSLPEPTVLISQMAWSGRELWGPPPGSVL